MQTTVDLMVQPAKGVAATKAVTAGDSTHLSKTAWWKTVFVAGHATKICQHKRWQFVASQVLELANYAILGNKDALLHMKSRVLFYLRINSFCQD